MRRIGPCPKGCPQRAPVLRRRLVSSAPPRTGSLEHPPPVCLRRVPGAPTAPVHPPGGGPGAWTRPSPVHGPSQKFTIPMFLYNRSKHQSRRCTKRPRVLLRSVPVSLRHDSHPPPALVRRDRTSGAPSTGEGGPVAPTCYRCAAGPAQAPRRSDANPRGRAPAERVPGALHPSSDFTETRRFDVKVGAWGGEQEDCSGDCSR